MKILIVEDDPIIAKALAQGLTKYDYQSHIVTDFEGVMEDFQELQPHLVLMDVNLPFFNGYYWCSQIRSQSTVPIIFISSVTDQMDQLMAIQMGADDYITKPLDIQLTLAKIQALLRRSYDFSQQEIKQASFNGVSLDENQAQLLYEGESVALTFTELQILKCLFNKGAAYSLREEILDFCWQNEQFIDDNTLAVNISRLRKKMKSIDLNNFILTKKGLGYHLNDGLLSNESNDKEAKE